MHNQWEIVLLSSTNNFYSLDDWENGRKGGNESKTLEYPYY